MKTVLKVQLVCLSIFLFYTTKDYSQSILNSEHKLKALKTTWFETGYDLISVICQVS